jgi:hypothetical protein
MLEKVRHEYEDVELTLEENAAIDLLKKYTPEKNYLTAGEEYRNVLLNNCTPENLSIYMHFWNSAELCFNGIDEMNFFRAYIFATKNNKWKKENIVLVKKAIIAALTYENIKTNAPLLNYLTSLTILREMIDYNLLDKKFEKEIKTIQINAEQANTKIAQKLHDKSCDASLDKMKREISLRDDLKIKLTKVLNRIAT